MTNATGPAGGWADLLGGRNGVLSLALAGGTALHAINVYVATTILPSVVADIGGINFYAWNTSLFIVASILASTMTPALLRRLGPRGAYFASAALFAIGSIACGLAPSMLVMLAGRVVQGFGGGFLLALSYAMVRLVLPESLWARGIALISGMWGIATLVGPAVGGLFAEYGMWRAAFWSLGPLALVFAALAAIALPAASDPRVAARKAGDPGAAPTLQIMLLTAAVLAIAAGSVVEALSWNVMGVMAAAILVLAMAVAERRARSRLLPTGSFSRGGVLGALYLSMMLLSMMVTSSEIFVPLFLQTLHDQTPLVAGYFAASMSAGWTVGSIVGSGAAGARLRWQLRLAPLPGLAGMIVLAALVPPGGDGSWAILAPIAIALVLVGLGVGLAWPHLLTRVLQVAPAGEDAMASASLTTVQLFATAAGAALAGMVVNVAGRTDPGGVRGASSAAFWLFAAFALAPLVCLFSIRKPADLQVA